MIFPKANKFKKINFYRIICLPTGVYGDAESFYVEKST